MRSVVALLGACVLLSCGGREGAPESSDSADAIETPPLQSVGFEFFTYPVREYGMSVRLPMGFQQEVLRGLETGSRFHSEDGIMIHVGVRSQEDDPGIEDVMREIRSDLSDVARLDTLPTGLSVIGTLSSGERTRRQLIRIAPGVVLRLYLSYPAEQARRIIPIADTLFGSVTFTNR